MSSSPSPVSASTVVYFITGTNRSNGIGFGLTERLAKRPNTLIFATARDPSKADALQQLAKQHSNIRIVRLSVDSDAETAAAVKQVQAEAGRVDVLLSNAGISNADAYERSEQVTIDKLRENFEINTVGPVRLFKAFFPLLSLSTQPKYITVSTFGASITFQDNIPSFYQSIYGASKAASNFLVRRVHVEHPNITAFPVHPGWVQTDMGNAGATVAGMKEAPLTLDTSVTAIVKLLDEATRATHSGKFWNAEDGKELPW